MEHSPVPAVFARSGIQFSPLHEKHGMRETGRTAENCENIGQQEQDWSIRLFLPFSPVPALSSAPAREARSARNGRKLQKTAKTRTTGTVIGAFACTPLFRPISASRFSPLHEKHGMRETGGNCRKLRKHWATGTGLEHSPVPAVFARSRHLVQPLHEKHGVRETGGNCRKLRKHWTTGTVIGAFACSCRFRPFGAFSSAPLHEKHGVRETGGNCKKTAKTRTTGTVIGAFARSCRFRPFPAFS